MLAAFHAAQTQHGRALPPQIVRRFPRRDFLFAHGKPARVQIQVKPRRALQHGARAVLALLIGKQKGQLRRQGNLAILRIHAIAQQHIGQPRIGAGRIKGHVLDCISHGFPLPRLFFTDKNYAPSAPAAHIRVRLLLLPSGPDRVHAVISHGTRCVANIVYQTFIQITSAKYINLQTMLFTGSRAAQRLPAQGFSAARRYPAQRRPARAWLRPAPPPRP